MINTAGAAARKHKIDRREVDEVVFHRYQQYVEAKHSGFLDKVCVPLDLLSVQGKPMGRIDQDKRWLRITTGARSNTGAVPWAPGGRPRFIGMKGARFSNL